MPAELKELSTNDTYNLCAASALLSHALLSAAPAPPSAAACGTADPTFFAALSEEEARWALLGGFLLPLRGAAFKKGKAKPSAASAYVVRRPLQSLSDLIVILLVVE